MEFLLAANELSEMKYPPDTVEVALVYNNNEKAKVLNVYKGKRLIREVTSCLL